MVIVVPALNLKINIQSKIQLKCALLNYFKLYNFPPHLGFN